LFLGVVTATAIIGCWMGDPESYSVVVDNRTSSDLHFKAEVDEGLNLIETVPAHKKGHILYSLGPPAKSHRIMRGGMCTPVDIVAYDANNVEVARHPPGLCMRETWVIGAAPGTS
jgi:hypothetical protein